MLFTKCTEEWDNIIYITKDMIRDIYHIVGLCSDDYLYIIMKYHSINPYDNCN